MEVMLYDKCIVEYRAKKGSQVMIEYKIQKAKERTEDQPYQKEIMQAAYEGIHVRTFVLYSDEILEYRFKEMKADVVRLRLTADISSGTRSSRLSERTDD